MIALDIKSFFETIDHKNLKKIWSSLLNKDRLPADHFAVFRNVTSYCTISKTKLYERLGHYGPKYKTPGGLVVYGYLTQFNNIPTRLCTAEQFREKIAGGNGSKSLIKRNLANYGIPQGSPISDILANISMIEFDKFFSSLAIDLGGFYRRYSDDILIIIPGDISAGHDIVNVAAKKIKSLGSKVKIKSKKTQIFEFYKSADRHEFVNFPTDKGRSGFEYLGFRFDGRFAYIKNSTISNLRRKISISARKSASSFKSNNPGKTLSELKMDFNYELFEKRFRQVENWKDAKVDVRNWTFRTYMNKAILIMNDLGIPIRKQFRNERVFIRKQIHMYLEKSK